ncbi:phytase [Erythrobacter litoralis]|nr:phytase [Erythrobacter litoralis]
MRDKPLLAISMLGFVAACTTMTISGAPTVPVYAVAETEPVGTNNEDAADDPAIWRNAERPEDSLIVATDKKGGLYVYGLDGRIRSFHSQPGLNNVDLAEIPSHGIVVFASDRSDLANGRIALFRLLPTTGVLEPLASLPAGTGEAYGICGYEREGSLIVYTAPKEGNISEWKIGFSPAPDAKLLRSMQVPSQPEGCAVDPRNGDLYIGEEAKGIWRFGKNETVGEIVAPVDNVHLVADLEGLAIITEGQREGWLYASSQGDSTYMRYRLPAVTPAGRFRVAEGTYGRTEETDGIEAKRGDFGPMFPRGIFVAQDGQNGREAQNFKLVPLDAIEEVLSKP